MSQQVVSQVEPWIIFSGEVSVITRLSRSMIRVTCAGPEFKDFADNGFDARMRLILPHPEHGYAHLSRTGNWYQAWSRLDPSLQNEHRAYTVRAVRPEVGEIDFDMVLHGDAGAASRWIQRIDPGEPVLIMGPNARHQGPHGGVEFRVPAPGTKILLAGDETAQPAIATILEQLPAEACGTTIIEVPHGDDVVDLVRPGGMDVQWLVRGDRAPGEPLLSCFAKHAVRIFDSTSNAASLTDPLTEEDPTTEDLWEVPETVRALGGYAWIAGEAGMVRLMRQVLVNDVGVSKDSVAFMGYWRRDGRHD